MLSYAHLKDYPHEFVAATNLTLAEFLLLLPVFERVYETLYPLHLTVEGKSRRRRAGGGVKGGLARGEDLLPVLKGALRELGKVLERDAEEVGKSALMRAGTQELALDGTE